MNKFNNSILVMLGAWLCATPALSEELDAIVAVVNENVILVSELNARVDETLFEMQRQNITPPPSLRLRSQILEQLITKEAQLQRAKNLGISIDDDMVNQALTQMADRVNTTLIELPNLLAKEGIDYAKYREDIRDELKLEQLKNRDVVSKLDISREDIEQQVALKKKTQTEYFARHILLAVDNFDNDIDVKQAQNLVETLYKKINEGADVASLAAEYSNTADALEGGALGWRTITGMPAIYTDAIQTLAENEVSQPIRSRSGFHLVYLEKKREPEVKLGKQRKARHILLSRKNYPSVQASTRLKELKSRIEQGEDFAELAKLFSEDPGSKTAGGDLGWADPGTFVVEFEDNLSTLEINAISEPFETQYGWHIVQLLEEREANVSDAAAFNQAYGELRAQKAQNAVEDWARRLRDEAYVDIREDRL